MRHLIAGKRGYLAGNIISLAGHLCIPLLHQARWVSLQLALTTRQTEEDS